MTDTKQTPFTMVGSNEVEVCVDGVCELPTVQPTALPAMQPTALPVHEPQASAEQVSAQPAE